MSISLLELFQYIKKNFKIVLVCAVLVPILGALYVDANQSYVASTTIEYAFEEAKEGKNLKGGKLDPQEIMSPIVIESVISSLNLNTSVERIRSSVAITPFIDATTKAKQKALTDKGEDFEFFPTEYTVSFTYSGKNGAEYGVKVLNKLLEAYDAYIRQTYTGQSKIPDMFANIDYDKYDYMEICDLFDEQIENSTQILSSLNTQDPAFRSPKTGLTFGDLLFYFNNLSQTDVAKLYANVRVGCLSKNTEVLVKNYQYKVEELNLINGKKTEESGTSYDIMLDFYRQYKEGQIQNNTVEEGLTKQQTNNDVGSQIIREDDISKLITTYDSIMTKYVDSGTEALQAAEDMRHYQMLIEAFSNDNVSAEDKAVYLKLAQGDIQKINTEIKNYIKLANETLNDYNIYKGTQYLNYLSSSGTKAKLSKNTVLVFAFAFGAILGMMIAILLEVMKKIRERSELEARREKMALLEDGVMPKDFDKLPPLDRALFEAIGEDFREFKLAYLPIVNEHGNWVGAEALVRWESKEFGMVMPNEFISIAEKHGIMEMLGGWILKEACTRCKEWNENLSEDMVISVNFTLNQVSGSIFMDGIFKALDETKVNPKNIILEISNGGEVTDMEATAKKLSAIKTFGLRIAIDNFDSERSSVESLYNLPVDIVKIDRQHVLGIENDAKNQNFITNIINVAEMADVKVFAEGVETLEQAKLLWDMGISCLQGYYFSRPIYFEQFEAIYHKQEGAE